MLVSFITSIVLYAKHRSEPEFTLDVKYRRLITILIWALIYATAIVIYKGDKSVTYGTASIAISNVIYSLVCTWYLMEDKQDTNIWMWIMITGAILTAIQISVVGGVVAFLKMNNPVPDTLLESSKSMKSSRVIGSSSVSH